MEAGFTYGSIKQPKGLNYYQHEVCFQNKKSRTTTPVVTQASAFELFMKVVEILDWALSPPCNNLY